MCSAAAYSHALCYYQATEQQRSADLVGVCLLASGLGTIVHVIQIPIWRTRFVFGHRHCLRHGHHNHPGISQ